MKVLKIDYSYYFYPEKHSELDSFMEYVNQNSNRFIPLVQLLEENCIEPYFIDTEKVNCYINITTIEKIQESEITILSKEEYDFRLSECISKTCIDCVNYSEDKIGDNLEGHRNKLNLNGECDFKCTINDEE